LKTIAGDWNEKIEEEVKQAMEEFESQEK